jgi:sugar phosphate isomerase/epimerase
MSEWPVGLSTGCFYRRNILDCLGEIQQSGFSLVEICSASRHLDYHDRTAVEAAARKLRELKLEPYSFHAPFADHIDISSPNADERDRAVREIMTAAEAAATLGVGYFVIHPGPERSGIPHSEKFSRLEAAAGGLNRVAERCIQLGLGLVLENMLPHLFAGHVRDLLWILGSLETTHVGICLDTGHAYLSGDLTTVVHKLSGHLWMVHAHDNWGKRDDHRPPGEGAIDWRALLHQLHAGGFHGAFIMEVSGEIANDEVLRRAQEAQQYLRDISREVLLANLSGQDNRL